MTDAPGTRLCPELALPRTPYRTDGQGGPRPSFGGIERVDPGADPRWPDCQAVRYGFDLLDHGFPWEAHEVWEEPWRAAKSPDPAGAEFLQVLIQIAAARVLIRDGRPEGAARVAIRARRHLDACEGQAPRFGLTLAQVERALTESTRPDAEHAPLRAAERS